MTRFLMLLVLAGPLLVAGISCGVAHSHDQEDETIIIRKHDRGGFLGVSTQDMTPSLADSLKTSTETGALVKEVVDGSPAEKAGVKENDVIVEFNGEKIEDRWDLLEEVRSLKPGTDATLVVARGDRRETLKAVLGKEPASARRALVPHVPDIPVHPLPPRMPWGSYEPPARSPGLKNRQIIPLLPELDGQRSVKTDIGAPVGDGFPGAFQRQILLRTGGRQGCQTEKDQEAGE